MSQPQDQEDLRNHYIKLERLSRSLSGLSWLIMIAIVATALTCVLAITEQSYLVLHALISLSTLILYFLFDRSRKKGDIRYEEILDEIEWGAKSDSSSVFRVKLNDRLILRNYYDSRELPFIKDNSIQIYLIIHVIVFLIPIIVAIIPSS